MQGESKVIKDLIPLSILGVVVFLQFVNLDIFGKNISWATNSRLGRRRETRRKSEFCHRLKSDVEWQEKMILAQRGKRQL